MKNKLSHRSSLRKKNENIENEIKSLKMEAITINDGLSQGMINCIYQDHFGFMWFGTLDGLNRYDGYHFTVYRYETNDSNSISGNWITSICEDSKGRLWVGTALNGLNIFDRETEKFIRLQAKSNVPNTLSDNRVFSISKYIFLNILLFIQYTYFIVSIY